MFCPQCGISQSDELKFCTSCGANLLAVRELVTKGGTGDEIDRRKNWVSAAQSIGEMAAEVVRAKANAKREIERRRGITSEVRRLREVKAGVMVASVGIAVGVFLSVFMQGIILSGKVGPDEAEILSRIWIVGVIPLCIGLGLMLNGLFVKSAAKVETPPHVLESEAQRDLLQAGAPAERIPSAFSVTEQTTRQLSGAEKKD